MWVVTAWRETTLFPSSWMTCEYILNSFWSKEALAEDLGASKCPGKTELCQSLGGWSWVKLWSAFLCWRAEALLRTKTRNWNWGLKHENEPARQRARRNGLWTEYSKYSIPEREETWHLQGKKKKKMAMRPRHQVPDRMTWCGMNSPKDHQGPAQRCPASHKGFHSQYDEVAPGIGIWWCWLTSSESKSFWLHHKEIGQSKGRV